MRRFVPLAALALVSLGAVPWPAKADERGSGNLSCFVNETLVLARIQITQYGGNGLTAANDWVRVPARARHCPRFSPRVQIGVNPNPMSFGWAGDGPAGSNSLIRGAASPSRSPPVIPLTITAWSPRPRCVHFARSTSLAIG